MSYHIGRAIRFRKGLGAYVVFVLGLWGLVFVFTPALGARVEVMVNFDPNQHLIAGSERVSWEAPPSEATFALLANLRREENPYLSGRARDETYAWGFDPAWTEIDGVFWEGPEGEIELSYELLPAPPTLQTYSLDDVLLKVRVPQGEGKLRIDFRTRFPHILTGEPGRLSDIYTWRFGWCPIPIEPPEGDYWPLLLPAHNYDVSLSVPDGWTAALPGEVEVEEGDKGTTYHASFPSPVRSITLFIGPEEELRTTHLSLSGLTIEGVALPGDEDKVRVLMTYIPEILSDYGRRFGPYPYERLLLVEHPNQVGVAFAADGVVFIPKWFFDRLNLTAEGMLSRYGRFVLAHELAHQWWGVGVGVDLDAENWLSEGLAQYASISWFEEKFGAEGGNVFRFERKGLGEAMAESAVGFANLREHFTELPYLRIAFQGFDEAVVKPTAELDYAQATSERLYDKGYLVLRALAHLVGETAFDSILAKAAERFRGGTMSVAEFKELIEGETGKDLTWFFEAWVWGDAQADYAIERVVRRREGDEFVTEVYLSRAGEGFLPVEVEVRGAGEEREREVWPRGEGTTGSLLFKTPFPVREVVVDPGHYALDVDRLNNVWPTRFVWAVEKNALPLDGFLVRGDPTSRTILVQYLDRFGWAIYPNARAVEGFVRYGREATVWGFAQVTDALIGEITLVRHLWSRPETGAAGDWWFPSGDFTISLSRRPYPVVGVGLSWQGSLPRVFWGEATLLSLPSQGGRLSLSHTQELALLPHTYLDLTVACGLASPGLPQELTFGLPELHTLENGPRGERKLLLSASLSLPPDRDVYSLAGAALISEVIPRLYLSWGKVWTENASSGTILAYAEVGGELSLRIELLGGLLSLKGILGMAWPLLQGKGVFYFGLEPET